MTGVTPFVAVKTYTVVLVRAPVVRPLELIGFTPDIPPPEIVTLVQPVVPQERDEEEPEEIVAGVAVNGVLITHAGGGGTGKIHAVPKVVPTPASRAAKRLPSEDEVTETNPDPEAT